MRPTITTISLAPAPQVQKVAFMTSFGDTLPPIGYVTFCRENRDECRPGRRFADRIQLTAAKYQEIEEVNDAVNKAVAPITDLELYGKAEVWSYPAANKGDCEDYVLLKRRMLIERGYPESTLADHRRARREQRRPRGADRSHRCRRLHSRQQAARGHALGRYALHVRQAAVGAKPAGVDFPAAAGHGAANRGVSL